MEAFQSAMERFVSKTSDAVGWIASIILLSLVSLIVVDVCLRYVFNSPLSFTLEVVELAMVVIVFTSMTVCTGKQGHLDIDVLVRKMPKQAQNIIQTIVDIMFAGLFAVIAWQAILRTIHLSQTTDFSTMLKVPYYPFYAVIAICSVLINLFIITQILNRFIGIPRK